MTSVTALMGPAYEILKSNRDYLIRNGVPPSKASSFVAKFYRSVVSDAVVDCEEEGRFDDLIREQTPGGLSEQAIGNLIKKRVFEAYDAALDAMMKRLDGGKDGFL
eukprot:CAMPEP_0172478808 /NCGR_PEP_ID=MMETSP1066-20121228/2984_1 /TAXON_ID=671091 /ORGANISM="Coscinodiscus wailesii, Strain CCMP2513" /LENGTH=105 /DNA_ID=CAMNT_0013238683 /DNA_START=570 /DNA_END=887 /DNA_ORIENTATION=+